jgi:hypothetical protein
MLLGMLSYLLKQMFIFNKDFSLVKSRDLMKLYQVSFEDLFFSCILF